MSRLNGKDRRKSLKLAAEAGLGIGYSEMIALSGVQMPDSIDPELGEFHFQTGKSSILERIIPINVLKNERMVAEDRCDGCSKCCDVCPTGSIRMSESQTPIWNMSLCIECWRCREHCPSNAIAVVSSDSVP
jgi:heterodisulfide reductase subunit A-like polyferredoxin